MLNFAYSWSTCILSCMLKLTKRRIALKYCSRSLFIELPCIKIEDDLHYQEILFLNLPRLKNPPTVFFLNTVFEPKKKLKIWEKLKFTTGVIEFLRTKFTIVLHNIDKWFKNIAIFILQSRLVFKKNPTRGQFFLMILLTKDAIIVLKIYFFTRFFSDNKLLFE